MNLQQLEYIVAVDTYRHFGKAAEKCFITQPTLSSMIHKLEEELGVRIFQRKEKPVLPTEVGKQIIAQARIIVQDTKHIQDIVHAHVGEIKGELKMGILPTLAPYLCPLFLQKFVRTYKQVRVTIKELLTDEILDGLKKGKVDVGVLVTPVKDNSLQEDPLFYEEFVAYVSVHDASYKRRYLDPAKIDASKLWLLEEGHCYRSQIMNLCHLRKVSEQDKHFYYEAGSIETLKKMVERNEGITVLPELALLYMNESDKHMVRRFQRPVPVREVSVLTQRDYAHSILVNALKKQILSVIPKHMLQTNKRTIIKQ
jgi:LysR family transcriptional regulator, hydrogen peroxide-inducible genes activator